MAKKVIGQEEDWEEENQKEEFEDEEAGLENAALTQEDIDNEWVIQAKSGRTKANYLYPMEKPITSPLSAIRAKCKDCIGSAHEVKKCSSKLCPLWSFRFGKNPYRKRELTDQQKEDLKERMANARKARFEKE